jgi:hypothetical protein
MLFGQLHIPLMLSLLDTIIRSKNIADTHVSAICLHILCFDLVKHFPSTFSNIFISISSALVVPATDVVVLVIVVVVVVVLVIEAAVAVLVVACKYCLFDQLNHLPCHFLKFPY